MKRQLTLQTVIFIFLYSFIIGQMRYQNEIFDEVLKTENVVYGNAPDLPYIFLFEWNTVDIDLEMDIYQPSQDTITNRPVIIFIHPGAFFTGNNEVDDMVSLANSSAKRGFLAVSISYRLGLNVLSDYSGERAVYRGVQDLSAAIRFLRENYLQYGIDKEKIYAWGSSAGSFVGLHSIYTEDDERPESTYGGFGDPDLGCINCEGNDYDQDGRPNALISCWGAIGDLDWIGQENTIPLIMFHGTADDVVPYESGYPFTVGITLPFVYGSSLISERLNNLNIQNIMITEIGEDHEYWGASNGTWDDGPNEFLDSIKNSSFSFLFENIYPYEIGDVDNSGEITNLDYLALIQLILHNQYSIDSEYYSDLNNNQKVDIFDLLELIQIIYEE